MTINIQNKNCRSNFNNRDQIREANRILLKFQRNNKHISIIQQLIYDKYKKLSVANFSKYLTNFQKLLTWPRTVSERLFSSVVIKCRPSSRKTEFFVVFIQKLVYVSTKENLNWFSFFSYLMNFVFLQK